MKQAIVICLLCLPIVTFAQKQGRLLADSLIREIDESEKDTAQVTVLDRLSFTYAQLNPDSGLLFALRALSLAEEIGWQRGKAVAYSDLGTNYNAKSDYTKALEYYTRALNIYHELNAKTSEAAVLSNIALVYHRQSSYARALEYYLRALDIMEATDNKRSMAVTLENIGTLYKEQHDYVKTRRYYERAIELNKELNDEAGMARNLGNMGIIYDAEGRHDEALRAHGSAYETNKASGNKYGMQINLANIGIVYLHMGMLQQALEKQQQALGISEELGDKTSIAINAGNLGETYYMLAQKTGSAADKQQAIEHLGRAVNLCMETNALAPAAEFVKYLVEAYLLSGNYKKAYEYQKMLTGINDTVYNVQSKLQIANLENKREVALKEKDLLLKDKQIEIAQLEINKRRAVQGFYLVGLVLLAVVLGITVKNIIAYRRSNRLLTDEKKLHMETILNQNIKINARNEILEELADRYSHDVRGQVATILGLSQMFNRQEYADENNKVIIDGITDSAGKLDKAIKEIVRKENELTKLSKEDEGIL